MVRWGVRCKRGGTALAGQGQTAPGKGTDKNLGHDEPSRTEQEGVKH
jgi:hypothetical protein